MELATEHETTLVVVTHSESLASHFNRKFQLDQGRLEPMDS